MRMIFSSFGFSAVLFIVSAAIFSFVDSQKWQRTVSSKCSNADCCVAIRDCSVL